MTLAPVSALLLVDYKNEFFPRHKHSPQTTNLEELGQRLHAAGVELHVKAFADLDLCGQDYRESYVFYQSAQDPGLHYKGYLEDLLFGLHLLGAKLCPTLPLFRAHHNKVMMEVLRDVSGLAELSTLRAHCFGTYEDFVARVDQLGFPVVLKISDGDSARGVVLARDRKQALREAKRLMRSIDLKDAWDNSRRRLTAPDIKRHSLHRRKIIAQPYVPDLDHDYKVVWMGGRLFFETRRTRDDDFRASGSGRRHFPEEPDSEILECVDKIVRHFDAPYASIDLMRKDDRLHVGEMQFLRFGTTPVIAAPRAWEKTPGGSWTCIEGPFTWEEELARAIQRFVLGPGAPQPRQP